MTQVTDADLATVIGGATSIGAKKLDAQTEAALTKLTTDIKELASAKQSPTSQLMPLMALALITRNR